MTVKQLERGVDSHELEEWLAYFKIRCDKKGPELTGDALKNNLKAAFAGAKAKAQRKRR